MFPNILNGNRRSMHGFQDFQNINLNKKNYHVNSVSLLKLLNYPFYKFLLQEKI